jgi:hypothetical protein
MAFAWIDTKNVRPKNSQFFAILNDKERSPSGGIDDALQKYEVVPVLWSKKESVRDKFIA